MSEQFDTLAAELSHTSLNKIIQRFDLKEIGAPYITLRSPMQAEPVGPVRIFHGGPISKLVYIGMKVPMIKLDSHMIFAFTSPSSPVPHFTVDSVYNSECYAFHVDLWPRVDLGANLAYINHVMRPLTEEFLKVKNTEGVWPAHLQPHQWAVFSPWMMAWRATDAGFRAVRPSIDFFLDYWLKLVEHGIAPEAAAGHDPAALTERDRIARSINFNPDIDPVWAKVDRLVGAEMSERLREIMKNQGLEEE